MKLIYSGPLRVYFCLGALALIGMFAGFHLPISLFPNSSKPIINVNISYGPQTADEFIQQHGNHLESYLRAIVTESVEIEKTRVSYFLQDATFEVEFKWGTPPRSAIKEVEAVVHAYSNQLPAEVRDQIGIYPKNSNSGFFAASFYSSTRSLDELYQILEPALMPRITKLSDVSKPQFFNPAEKEVRIEADGERMAAFQLLPKDIDQAIHSALTGFNGGSLTVGLQQLSVQIPKAFNHINDLNNILISTPAKQSIHLSDVAQVDYDLKTTNLQSFKTSGLASLILISRPRIGGNVKRMSEEIVQEIQAILPNLPNDIQYKILVDPSQYILSAIKNVFHEVAIGAFLAVLILYIFIGSFKNTITAAIEIPLSIILAFIPMKLFGMSLNLISLGGLALSAGMNVDASVVVMENIFRHFENARGYLDSQARLKILLRAVKEVQFPVIGSTVASLVVFLPLAFTSDLTYAVLGDLAKTVVFSHGFSAFVALILVPTIRLQLMSHGGTSVSHSPFEKQINQLENCYVRSLDWFLCGRKFQRLTYLSLFLMLALLSLTVLPNLPKEVIGKPDTQDLLITINTQGNALLKQMEDTAGEIEAQLLNRFSNQIEHTLVEVDQPNSSWIMAHLKNKSEMKRLWKEMENYLTNTSLIRYTVNPWNPAELNIPDPPEMKLVIRGGNLEERVQAARDLEQLLEEKQIFPRLWNEPNLTRADAVIIKPFPHLWSNFKNQWAHLNLSDLADLVRVMTTGRKIGEMHVDGMKRDVSLRYSSDPQLSAEDLGVIPIGALGKIIPFKALCQIQVEEAIPAIYQENQREMVIISGMRNSADPPSLSAERLKKAKLLVMNWKKEQLALHSSGTHQNPGPMITFEDAREELSEAIKQLISAVALSVLLIFLILVIQFGDFINSLLVLVSIPLGIIGVFISLFIFKSTLSLNSILGIILLNGIVVANSIILVDFLKQRVDQGLTPHQAALDAARKRLRPIFITSLTTILGMFPIALGLGEGGQVLQPLGIAVAGGLWVSMGLTLFIVPALQVDYLNWKFKRLSKASTPIPLLMVESEK